MNAAEVIKESLSMWDVSEQYGYEPNRSGNICCPFHGEKTPSLKIYKQAGRGFYCYGCGAGGSVIDFVMRLFELDFVGACTRLNHDFGLGISADKPDPHTMAEFARKRQEQRRAKEKLRQAILALCAEHRRLWLNFISNPPEPDQPPPAPWVEAAHKLDYISYQIQELQTQETR